jgi:hypothetical protein
MRAISTFEAIAALLRYESLKRILPIVPYAIVPMNRTVQTLVMISPIGMMRIVWPGRTNGDADATTSVWMGGETWDFVGATSWAKTPDTKVAWLDARVVLTVLPAAVVPVNVTTGTRTFWSAALQLLAEKIMQVQCELTFPCWRPTELG